MEPVLAFLKDVLASQPVLQTLVGGATFLLIAYMVMRATKEKNSLPAPAPGGITDTPTMFSQGPRELLDIMREKRDFLRRISEDMSNVRECTRIMRDEAKRQTEILSQMSEDQRVEHRVAAERHGH
jgi:hypothetical protein